MSQGIRVEGGGDVCAPSVNHPGQTLPAGGYGFPTSPITSDMVLDIVKEPLSMATADLTTVPLGRTWPFPQTPPLLSTAEKGKYTAGSDESMLDP